MRKFGIKYSQLHPSSGDVRDAFVAVHRPGDWQKVLDVWYRDDLPGRDPADDAEGSRDRETLLQPGAS